MSYSVVNVDDARARLAAASCTSRAARSACEAFGINWFALPPGAEGKEHDEKASGQEEVYVVVAGSWQVDRRR